MRNDGPKIEGEQRLTVMPDDSASRWGSLGVEVLSTPAILGHTEQLCAELLAPYLEPGEMTVGVNVLMHHRAPALVGDDIVIKVVAPSPGRQTEFQFEVTDARGTVLCDGVHRRAAVDAARFRERLLA